MDTNADDISQYMAYLKQVSPGADQASLKQYETYLRSQPGSSPGNPASVDMFPGKDSTRVGVGFGDPENGAYQAYKQGFKNPSLDSGGNLVAQDAKGRYVKDATNFWPNQLNTTPVNDVPSAAKAAQQILSSAHPINWAEANLGPAFRGAGWLGGATLGGLAGVEGGPLAFASATAGAGTGSAAGEQARQAIGRMAGVYHAPEGSPQSNQDTLHAGEEGAISEAGGRLVGMVPLPSGMGGSVQGLISKVGSKVLAVPSWMAMGGSVPYSDVARNIENPVGVSAAGARDFGLRTAEKMESELGQNVGIAKQKIQQSQDEFRSNYGSTYPDMTKPVDQSIEFIDRHTPTDMNPDSRLTQAERDELLNETGRMSQANAGTLLTQSQRLGESLPGKVYDGSTSQRGDLTTGQLKRMSGGIRGALHELDPDGLGAADQQFSTAMSQAKTLRPVEGENQEAVVNNLWGKNNTARQEAARELTPDVYGNELLDLKSRQAFDNAGAFGASPKEQMARGLVSAAAGTGAYMAHNSSPEAMATVAAILAASSPKVNYLGGQMTGRLLQRAPQMELYSKMPSNPWTISKENK